MDIKGFPVLGNVLEKIPESLPNSSSNMQADGCAQSSSCRACRAMNKGQKKDLGPQSGCMVPGGACQGLSYALQSGETLSIWRVFLLQESCRQSNKG